MLKITVGERRPVAKAKMAGQDVDLYAISAAERSDILSGIDAPAVPKVLTGPGVYQENRDDANYIKQAAIAGEMRDAAELAASCRLALPDGKVYSPAMTPAERRAYGVAAASHVRDTLHPVEIRAAIEAVYAGLAEACKGN